MPKVQFLLQDIKRETLVLPEFQREYEWNRQQAKNLLDSILKGYPTGSILIWKTSNPPALKNKPGFEPEGPVEVLLDGQQRLTALYLLAKGELPPYYSRIESNNDPRKLHYNLKTRELKYYSHIEMENNPLWVSVVDCLGSNLNLQEIIEKINIPEEERFSLFTIVNENLNLLQAIPSYNYPTMRVKEGAALFDALQVFDRVNTGGTPLSESDVALAYMCSHWGGMRRKLKGKRREFQEENLDFDLKFFIRAMNAVINGRAYYDALHDVGKEDLKAGWEELDKILDYLLNILKNQAYVYATEDLNTPNVLIPVIGFLAQNNSSFKSESEINKFLYWLYAALYTRRYSSSVDQHLEKDLKILRTHRPIENLISTLKEEEGSLEVAKGDLEARGVGHPLYDIMCFVIRKNGAKDWANNINLANPYGADYQLHRHHIFPKAVLKEAGYDTGKSLLHYNLVHEISNRIPLSREGNLEIFDSPPNEYLPEVKEKSPGNLERSLIPTNSNLWQVENYELFLEKRRELIAEAINGFMDSLLVGREVSKIDIESLIRKGEGEKIEFKARLRTDSEEGAYNLEGAVVKSVAGFLNSEGGTLLIGVNDKGKIVGIEQDYQALGKSNRDGFEIHLTNLLAGRLGKYALLFSNVGYETVDDKTICMVQVDSAPNPVYADIDDQKKFFVRLQSTTRPLEGAEADSYRREHFGR